MFRAKTVKRGNKKLSSNPITPASVIVDTKVVDEQPKVEPVSGAATEPVPNLLPLSLPLPAPLHAPIPTKLPESSHVQQASDRNSNAVNTENMLSKLLDAESKSAVHRPWLRLERGLRMRLLRAFVEKHQNYSPAERSELLLALVDALDKKSLNSKSQITYNQEIGEITEINSLKATRNTSGKLNFRIEPPNRGTKKARRPTMGSDSD
jgi:hypothetical protein